jgi:thiol-disulfide isomerase/thioredoxin
MKNLVKDQKKLNEVTDYLFNLLEEHSLVHASEYLAVSVLNQSTCTINGDLAKQLETYRTMKKGNIAPELVFDEGFFANPSLSFSAIADLKSKNTLVVFGASWCPKCKEEIQEIVSFYESWKAKGLEVVFISLDEDTKSFMDFTSKFPFSAYCDLKKWNSKNVANYYVFATPTMFLLNDKREIVFRPSSLMQVDTWLNTP